MANHEKDGGPAFGYGNPERLGMTLRDYFAIHAPEDIINDIAKQMLYRHQAQDPYCKRPEPPRSEFCARARFQFADMMLKEREQ